MLIEGILIEEQSKALAVPRYKRKLARLDYRNGFYKRDTQSSLRFN